MEQFVFWAAATTAVLSSIMVVTRKNPIYSALFMLVAFGSIAVIFLQLGAPFIAAMHLMVYAGAVMVLFLFVIMLLNLREKELEMSFSPGTKNIVGLLSLALFLIFGAIIHSSKFTLFPPVSSDFGSVEMVGTKMFSDFVLPFELLSLLIIVAILGAVLLAKKKV